jgi:4-diphosphocytidyl-2-C-methyl-D-erythritol kinase
MIVIPAKAGIQSDRAHIVTLDSRFRGNDRTGSQAPVLTETAHAKVNLALHVRARRGDGYHEIESLFAFCRDGDLLAASLRDDGIVQLHIDGPFADQLGSGEDNLVLRAARALQGAAGTGQGADLALTKNLPIASGIGGGSADAAAALRLLTRLWGIRPFDISLFEIAGALGADVPACLGSQTVFGSGVGERLEPADIEIEGMPILLVNPGLPCATGPVFRGWDGTDRGALDPASWREGRNDLEAPARALVPEIDMVLAALAPLPGVTLARMSGSGATCFALFDGADQRDRAAATIRAAHPGWWTMASTLR